MFFSFLLAPCQFLSNRLSFPIIHHIGWKVDSICCLNSIPPTQIDREQLEITIISRPNTEHILVTGTSCAQLLAILEFWWLNCCWSNDFILVSGEGAVKSTYFFCRRLKFGFCTHVGMLTTACSSSVSGVWCFYPPWASLILHTCLYTSNMRSLLFGGFCPAQLSNSC